MERAIHGIGKDFVSPQNTKKVERDLGRLSLLTGFEAESEENLRRASELVQDGTYLVFVSNHTHHGNVGVFNTIVDSLNPRPADVYIAVARTLSEGGQNEGLVRFSQNYEMLRSPEGIHQVPFVVDKDLVKMRERVAKGEMTRDELKLIVNQTRQNRDALFETLYDDAMFMVFPETTTEGGKYNPKIGKRNGMLRVTSGILPQLYEEATKRGRKIAYVPVSINGFGQVLEPRTTKVKPKAIAKIALSYIKQDHWIPNLIRATVGEPCDDLFFSQNELVQINGSGLEVIDAQSFTDSIMGEVARSLDEELRGEYSDSKVWARRDSNPHGVAPISF